MCMKVHLLSFAWFNLEEFSKHRAEGEKVKKKCIMICVMSSSRGHLQEILASSTLYSKAFL